MSDYALIEWHDADGERVYAHPWCARWTVAKDDGSEAPSTMKCRNCDRVLPLQRECGAPARGR